MATEGEIRSIVLEPMLALYAQPRGLTNPQLALTQYVHALKPYKAEALEGAWVSVRNGREMSTWPTIGEIVKCVRDWIHSNVKPEGKSQTVHVEGGKEDWKRYPENAIRAMSTSDGQMALTHGYGRILHDHVNKHGWLEGFDHAKAKGIDAEMREQLADMEANGDGFGGAILGMGKRRLDTEDQLKSKYLRRAAA